MIETAEQLVAKPPPLTEPEEWVAALARLRWEFVYGIVYRCVRNVQDAEDITQDAFVEILRLSERGRGYDPGRGASLDGWLWTITWHRSIDFLRRKRRRLEDSLDVLEENVHATSASTEEQVLGSERDRIVHDSLNALSPKLKEAIVLVDVLNYTYEEAATLLGLKASGIKDRLKRGRPKFRRLLHERGITR